MGSSFWRGMRVSAHQRRPVVLLLDNGREPCQLLAQRLRGHGFTVVIVTASEALLACRIHSGPIDVLVSDVDLPGIRADELARQARLMHPAMRAIFLYDPPAGTAIQAWPITAGAYVSKPYTVSDLADALYTVIQQPR